MRFVLAGPTTIIQKSVAVFLKSVIIQIGKKYQRHEELYQELSNILGAPTEISGCYRWKYSDIKKSEQEKWTQALQYLSQFRH
jgi:hypothetical protein